MAPDQNSIVEVVRRALTSRRAEFVALIRRRAGAELDAEEILQAALQRALERAPQLRDPARAEAWFGRIVRNVLIDELRRERHAVRAITPDDLAAPEVTPARCGCVLSQASKLRPDYATILERVVVNGTPVTQVATELGVTPNNAMVRLHRARVALRKRMVAHCGTTSLQECSDCVCTTRGCCDGVPASSEPAIRRAPTP
jgi:RNA polymerase sigma-70 factor (ECF subfamily)